LQTLADRIYRTQELYSFLFQEKEASLMCSEMYLNDPTIDCKPYYDNYKNCNKFWTAVQVYRSMNMRKTRYDLPEGEEYDQWKKQLPEWLVTKKLNIPDMVKEQQKAVNSEE
jgi:hypothetical protein